MKGAPILNSALFENITINLLDKCNLRCGYCFRDSGSIGNSLGLTDVKRILDFFHLRNNERKTIVQFTGGEIFLHKDIFKIIEHTLSLQFIVRLQTNGMIFSKFNYHKLNVLRHDNVIIKVSIDGWDGYTHDFYRGKNSFGPALNGVKLVREITPRIGIKTVVHERNFSELYRMLDLCHHLNIKSWAYNILREKGRCDNKGTIKEVDVLKRIIPFYNQSKYQQLLGGSNILTYHIMNLRKLKVLPLYFFVNSDGGIYLTDNVTPTRKAGSIYGKELKSEFSLEKVLETISARQLRVM